MQEGIMTIEQIRMPRNMHLAERQNSLEFEYSWFKVKYLMTCILTPVFAYFLINSGYISGNLSLLTIPVILILVLAFSVLYYSVIRLVNTTKIHVTNNHIAVAHGPLPYFRNLYLKKEEVTQLYVTKYRKSHRYYLYSTAYQINVILKNQRVVTLVRGLQTLEQGRFIEQKIEDFFNITDIPVKGEEKKG
jgi:hypothetical protein